MPSPDPDAGIIAESALPREACPFPRDGDPPREIAVQSPVLPTKSHP